MKAVIMDDVPSSHEVFCWYTNDNRWAVRKGEWKLLKNPIDPTLKTPIEENDSLFLANINTHPDELENLAQKYPEKVAELIQEYGDWYDKVK
jgi:arylsulfatase A